MRKPFHIFLCVGLLFGQVTSIPTASSTSAGTIKTHAQVILAPLTTAGTSTAYTLDYLAQVGTSWIGGALSVEFHTACGANPTLAVNGSGAKKLYKSNGTSAPAQLGANECQAVPYLAVYDQSLDSNAGGFIIDTGGGTGSGSGTVNSGGTVAGCLTFYPSSGTTVDDVVSTVCRVAFVEASNKLTFYDSSGVATGTIDADDFTIENLTGAASLFTLTDQSSDPSAPGSGKTALYSKASEPWFRAGAAGSATPISYAAKTETLTNKTIDAVSGTGVVLTIESQPYLAMAGCNGSTAGLLWNSPTSNAGTAACVGSNFVDGVADFDAATDESLHTQFMLPSDFTGTVDVSVNWFAAATSGSVRFGVSIDCTAAAEALDPAQSNLTTFAGTPDGTTNRRVVTTQTSVTITGCAADEYARLRFFRDADGTSGTDDMTGDARVLGLRLKVRRAM